MQYCSKDSTTLADWYQCMNESGPLHPINCVQLYWPRLPFESIICWMEIYIFSFNSLFYKSYFEVFINHWYHNTYFLSLEYLFSISLIRSHMRSELFIIFAEDRNWFLPCVFLFLLSSYSRQNKKKWSARKLPKRLILDFLNSPNFFYISDKRFDFAYHCWVSRRLVHCWFLKTNSCSDRKSVVSAKALFINLTLGSQNITLSRSKLCIWYKRHDYYNLNWHINEQCKRKQIEKSSELEH